MNPTSASFLSPWLRESRAIVHLAAPLALIQLAHMAIITTDSAPTRWPPMRWRRSAAGSR